MKTKILFYYGFTGRLNFQDLFINTHQAKENNYVLISQLRELGVYFHKVDEQGFEFILGHCLKEQNLNNNEIKQVMLTDYMFLLNQVALKNSTDILFKEVNKVLENNGCYTFKDQDYSFLTLSVIE